MIAVPTLTLTMRGGANISYFIFALILLGTALWLRAQPPETSAKSARCFPVLLYVSLALPIVSVLFTQLSLHDFLGQPYDAPSRLLLAMLLLLAFSQFPETWLRWLRHVQWGLCAGAIGAMVAIWVSPQDAATRHVPGFATAITFGNIGLTLGVCALLSLGWRLTRSPLEPALKILSGVAGLYASVLSGTRGGWLALVFLIVLYLLLSRMRPRNKALIFALSLVALAGVYAANPHVRMRIAEAETEYSAAVQNPGTTRADLTASDTSIGLRLAFWRAAVDAAIAHPLTGIGSQRITDFYRQRVAQGLMPDHAGGFNHAHNDYLQSLAANGIPGLIARLAAYLVPLWFFIRAARAENRERATAGMIGAAVVMSYMLFGLTETMFAITMNTSFYSAMVVIFAALSLPEQRETS